MSKQLKYTTKDGAKMRITEGKGTEMCFWRDCQGKPTQKVHHLRAGLVWCCQRHYDQNK